jgi:hypothetical protein
MATTPNFNWSTPDNTGLVKNGALDIRTLGDSIDASLVDLKGGTTGQVLSKASNTDMDFTWATDASGIPATIFDAKGDIIAATAADTASRLAVGANNTVLTADSSTATGLKWATPAAGGGMTLISTTTLSGASVTLSSIPSTYYNLQLVIERATNSTADGKIFIDLNSYNDNDRAAGVDAGTAFTYGYGAKLQSQNAYSRSNADNGQVFILYNYTSTTTYSKPFFWGGYYFTSGSTASAFTTSGVALAQSAAAVSSIKVSNTGGNWAGGTITLYGVK